uniref:Uncharacterized protein n=1 Tax=Ditylenchus dipsaci TaxID=166011 RepID=A0A915CUF8_9BILA
MRLNRPITISSAENFMKSYKPNEHVSQSVPPTPSSATTPLSPERDTLRDELRNWRTHILTYFKRYEKMRENCVLLKNSEESLKKTAEDDAAKYERLVSSILNSEQPLRHELNKFIFCL